MFYLKWGLKTMLCAFEILLSLIIYQNICGVSFHANYIGSLHRGFHRRRNPNELTLNDKMAFQTVLYRPT